LLLVAAIALRLQQGRARTMLRMGLGVQVVAGVLLLGYWVVRSAG